MATHPNLSCVRTHQKVHRGDVNCCEFSPDGTQVATASSDRTAMIIPFSLDDDQETETKSLSLVGHSYHVNVCRFSPCGSLLATGSTDCTVRLWNVSTGQCTVSFSGRHKGSIRGLAFSADSTRLVSSAADDSVCVWDVLQGSCTKHWITDTEGVLNGVAWTASSWHLVVGSSAGHLMVWDLSRTALLHSTVAHDMGVAAVVVYTKLPASDEFVLSCGNDTHLKVWRLHVQGNTGNLSPVLTISGHTGPVYSCAISPDQQYIASGSGDKSVRLWHLDTGLEVSRGEGHTGYITSCSFSPCGRLIVSGASDRTIRFWKLTSNVNPMFADFPAFGTSSPRSASPRLEMPASEPSSWTTEEVCAWLSFLGLSQFGEAFRKRDITGKNLHGLDAKRLAADMGVLTPADRSKILRSLNELFPSDRSVPSEFICPISMEIMQDPVVAADGFSYERSAIIAWIAEDRFTSPMTNLPLSSATVVANRNLRTLIQRQLEQWQPTPSQ